MEDARALIESGMEEQAGDEGFAQSQSIMKESSDMREWLLASLPASMPLAEKATILKQLAQQKMTLALLKQVTKDELKDLGLCVGHRMVLWDALQTLQVRRQAPKMAFEELQSGVGSFDKNVRSEGT
jgi:hypothetical protein